MTSHIKHHINTSPKLGANERAILDKIHIPALKKIATSIVLLKMRLQFTGWLQYMLPLIPAFASFLFAAIISLLGITWLATSFLLAGLLLLTVFVFDLVTVKFRLHFPESRPERNDNLNLFDLMRARRSCRAFQTRKLTPADYNELMESVRFHSESTTIGTAAIRFEYISAPLTVWPTVNATEFLVAIAPKEYDRLAVIDIGRTLQKIVMDATRMGLATCWIGPGADQSSIKKRLADRFNPNEDHIICVCAVGYKSWYIPLFIRLFNRQMKWRLPLSSLFYADAQFEKPLDVEQAPFNQFGRSYEVCQWSPSSYNGQTTRCVGVMDGPESARIDFYANAESRYYAAVAVGVWCANWEMGCEALGIHGHFHILSASERGVQDETNMPQLPLYDVSWVMDEHV